MNNRLPYSLKNATLGFVLWWLFWAAVQTLVLHRLGVEWKLSLIDAAVSNSLLAGLSFAAILIYRFYQPGRSNRYYRFIFAFGITIFYCVALNQTLYSLLGGEEQYLKFLDQSMPIRFISGLLIISFVTLLNWMWNLLMDQKEQEQRRNETEQLAKEAELVRLRQQLQPHFLFNSLNSISALAGSKPDEARKMIQQLSDFLRGTLKKDEQEVVALREELEHLKLYLEIEKVRFGHRLNVSIVTGEDSLNAKIPPLLLQPIVENAIKFGLYGTVEAVEVSITAQVEEKHLFVEVKNPFDTETQTSVKGTGFGLSSVQRRLFLLFGRSDLLSTEKNKNVFVTRLRIPQKKA